MCFQGRPFGVSLGPTPSRAEGKFACLSGMKRAVNSGVSTLCSQTVPDSLFPAVLCAYSWKSMFRGMLGCAQAEGIREENRRNRSATLVQCVIRCRIARNEAAARKRARGTAGVGDQGLNYFCMPRNENSLICKVWGLELRLLPFFSILPRGVAVNG